MPPPPPPPPAIFPVGAFTLESSLTRSGVATKNVGSPEPTFSGSFLGPGPDWQDYESDSEIQVTKVVGVTDGPAVPGCLGFPESRDRLYWLGVRGT